MSKHICPLAAPKGGISAFFRTIQPKSCREPPFGPNRSWVATISSMRLKHSALPRCPSSKISRMAFSAPQQPLRTFSRSRAPMEQSAQIP